MGRQKAQPIIDFGYHLSHFKAECLSVPCVVPHDAQQPAKTPIFAVVGLPLLSPSFAVEGRAGNVVDCVNKAHVEPITELVEVLST